MVASFEQSTTGQNLYKQRVARGTAGLGIGKSVSRSYPMMINLAAVLVDRPKLPWGDMSTYLWPRMIFPKLIG